MKNIKFDEKLIEKCFLGFWANSGFGFCDMILGFGANSGFWSFDTIFGVQGSGFRFFDTILGFGVQGLGLLTPFQGLGFDFFTPHQGLGFWFFHTKLGFGVLVKKQKNPSKIHYVHQKINNLTRISPPARVRNYQTQCQIHYIHFRCGFLIIHQVL